jgi:hypothetical protein
MTGYYRLVRATCQSLAKLKLSNMRNKLRFFRIDICVGRVLKQNVAENYDETQELKNLFKNLPVTV